MYLCQQDFNEDFNFECQEFKNFQSKDLFFGTQWYTVCGNPHSNKFHYLIAVWILGMLGTFTYRIAFRGHPLRISEFNTSRHNEKAKIN